jgi:ABC-2 type transport system ATP-binding protein
VSDTIVEVRGVHKSFGNVHALAGVDLDVRRGEVYGLLGPNGAGKTTLINVLSTLLKPDEGTARVAGLDVVEHADEVRRRVGLAGQFAAVDDYLTGRETVEMIGRLYGWSRSEAQRRAGDVLERFSLSDAADRPARGYSGGMRRRLDLAASLVGEPELLYLDEPTTGIDPASRIEIWDLVEELVDAGATVLLTTQYLDEADALADRIGVIAEGELVSEGTADELKDNLGANEIHLRVGHHEEDETRAALRGIAELDRRAGGEFVAPATEGNRTLLEIVRRLDDHDIEPLELSLERPTLDDVFLALTGHATEDDDTGGGDDAGRDPRPGRRSRRRSTR